MNILAFDTCFAACSAAALSFDPGASAPDRLHGLFEPMATGHAERLVAMIGEVMVGAGLAFADLDRIAVTNGPGSFTGTRISVAAARALALSFSVDVVAVSSLAVMAEQAARYLASEPNATHLSGLNGASLLIAVDARRGEVYAQQFRTSGADPITAPLLLPARDAAALGDGPLIVAGSGAEAVVEAANILGRRAAAHLPGLLPDARVMCHLAATMQPGSGVIKPLYLRPADAKPQTGKTIERATT